MAIGDELRDFGRGATSALVLGTPFLLTMETWLVRLDRSSMARPVEFLWRLCPDWSRSGWWPSIRDEPAFEAVREHLELFAAPGDVWAETQILICLPDEDDTELGPPHVDVLPPLAPERSLGYKRILSVELTDTPEHGGGTVIHGPKGLVPVRQRQGDVLSLRPDVLHSGSPNFSGDVRMALFFRLLEPAGPGARSGA